MAAKQVRFTIILPPSAAQNPRGNKFAPDVFDYRERTTFNFFHDLIPERRAIIDAVHRAIEVEGEDALAEILGGDDAVRTMQGVYLAELLAARKRYAAGPLFNALDFPGLPTGAQRQFLEHSVIISGLTGVCRPDDLVPQYALPLSADIPGIGPVTEYWRPIVSPLLNEVVERGFVWDFLSDVERAVWDDEETYTKRAVVQFLDFEGNEAADSDTMRGKLVHHLAQQKRPHIESLESWRPSDSRGYRLVEDKSQLGDDSKQLVVVLAKR